LKKTKILACSTLLLLLSACSVETTNVEVKKQPQEPVKISSATKDSQEQTDTTVAKEQVDLIKALKTIEIGMTKQEVLNIMGNPHEETSYMFNGEGGYSLETPVPRINLDYSTGALVEGYHFETEFEDEVDIEGIYNKQRGDMVIIRLTDKEIVEQVFSIYLNKQDGKLYEYYKFPTKEVKDHIIYPYPEQS
jgi:hypothetical protein